MVRKWSPVQVREWAIGYFPMEIKCPKCQKPLERVEYEGVFIFLCPQGHGHWLGNEQLKTIVQRREHKVPDEIFEQVRKDLAPKPVETRILPEDVKCPVCGAMCDKVNYAYSSGIIIDRCPNGCGVWLDQGELEKIQAFVELWDEKAQQVAIQRGINLYKYREDMSKYRRGLLSQVFEMLLGRHKLF